VDEMTRSSTLIELKNVNLLFVVRCSMESRSRHNDLALTVGDSTQSFSHTQIFHAISGSEWPDESDQQSLHRMRF